mgnify:CR=1 FL=1
MTDHAHELRRHARKIAHPAGDVPAVMLAAADEIERLRTESAGLVDDMNLLRDNNTALRAKIEEMEKQEPVAQVAVHKTGGNAGIAWSARPLNEFDSLPLLREGDRLYLAPGAQPAPSVPEGISRVSPDFYWDSAKQHHIPTVLVEFEPVPVGSPNDAKGWQDRDRFAALITVAPEAKP